MARVSPGTLAKYFLWFGALSGIYLYAFPAPNLFYIGLSLAHVGLGVLAIAVAPFLLRRLRGLDRLTKSGIALLVLGVLAGIVIMIVGGTRPHLVYLFLHAIFSFAGVLLLLFSWLRGKNWVSAVPAKLAAQCAALFAIAALIGWERTMRA